MLFPSLLLCINLFRAVWYGNCTVAISGLLPQISLKASKKMLLLKLTLIRWNSPTSRIILLPEGSSLGTLHKIKQILSIINTVTQKGTCNYWLTLLLVNFERKASSQSTKKKLSSWIKNLEQLQKYCVQSWPDYVGCIGSK